MLTSRRLVLASAAIVLGLSACGSATKMTSGTTSGTTGGSVTVTTGTKSAPKVITFGAAGTGATTAASASPNKMMAIRNLTFVFDGALPSLADTGASWQFPAGFAPDLDRVASMAAAFGVQGPVRELPADQGGGWIAGPQDYSSATFSVSADGLGSWWFNPAPAKVATISACAVAANDPATPVNATSATDGSGDSVATTELIAPCPQPTPPAGVPDKADALTKAKTLFTQLGYDTGNYDFEFNGDQWSANVTAYLLLDGQRSPLSMTVGFGGEGAVAWASGDLATPVPGDAYPLAGVQTGIDRLNDQSHQWMGMGMGYGHSTMRAESGTLAVPAAGAGAGAVAPPVGAPHVGAVSGTISGTVEVAPPGSVVEAPVPNEPVPCDPAADCVPVDTTPVTVHLTSVKMDLTTVWDADNTVWLLPVYTFGDADGGQYSVIAVTDEYLHLATPDVTPKPPTTDVVTTDVAPSVGAPTTDGTPSTGPGETTAPSNGSSITVDAASAALVKLTEADATAAATAHGWEFRIVQRDGVDLPATADYRPDRVNVAVAAGAVVAVQSIG